jgi:hypothetical protein
MKDGVTGSAPGVKSREWAKADHPYSLCLYSQAELRR